MPPDSFAGKVAIVTGAANEGSIGIATARTLAGRGAAVVLADVNAEDGEARAAECREAGLDCSFVAADVRVEEEVEALVAKTVEAHGRLDVIHNNAAAMELLPEDGDVTGIDLAIWNQTLAVDLTGPMLGCKHAIPAMLDTGGGSIVNTSSVSSQGGDPSMISYGVAKAGVSQLTRAVASQWGRQGIRCNAVAPGLTITAKMREGIPQAFMDAYLRHNLTPYGGDPQDIANCVAFLASDEARYVTGHVLRADGGIMSATPIAAELRGAVA